MAHLRKRSFAWTRLEGGLTKSRRGGQRDKQLDVKQLEWDEINDLLQVERKVDETEKPYRTMPSLLHSAKQSASDHSEITNGTEEDFRTQHDFNTMDYTDIVIETAHWVTHRVWDYYTRDRFTPRVDAFWGGKSNLTETGGFKVEGTTTIVFRRKLAANEPTDHSIVNDLVHVIWAKGQKPSKFKNW
ncbi:predicted protein [Culex quinquefasciatus]|uniref:Predicted protein n=1 Tax=Culex quinquefasciatus TaxID=7176 RepID=B0X5S7_CULQU|nr:predicted protein [Culex quinquefasciatus]|eukprot:XP_001864999.1 predicted protein [Culex quinquefasciatus]